LKVQLNEVKAQLNDYVLDDWHRHTKATNPAGRVLWTIKDTCNPELLTQVCFDTNIIDKKQQHVIDVVDVSGMV
jgi:hypothetical protein